MAQDDRVRKSSDGFDIVEVYRRQNEAISRIHEQLAEQGNSVRSLTETAKLLRLAGYSPEANRSPEQQEMLVDEKKHEHLSKMASEQQKTFSEKTNLMLQYVTPVLANRMLRRLEMAPTRSTKRRN